MARSRARPSLQRISSISPDIRPGAAIMTGRAGGPCLIGVPGLCFRVPDGANFLTLAHHTQLTGKKIFVVSGDGDWKRVCEKHPTLIFVEHLSEMIDKAIRAEWRSDDLWSDEELLG